MSSLVSWKVARKGRSVGVVAVVVVVVGDDAARFASLCPKQRITHVLCVLFTLQYGGVHASGSSSSSSSFVRFGVVVVVGIVVGFDGFC